MKWYQTQFGIWICLFLCFPVGIYLLWKYGKYSKTENLILSITFILLFVFVIPKQIEKNFGISINNTKTSQNYNKSTYIFQMNTLEFKDYYNFVISRTEQSKENVYIDKFERIPDMYGDKFFVDIKNGKIRIAGHTDIRTDWITDIEIISYQLDNTDINNPSILDFLFFSSVFITLTAPKSEVNGYSELVFSELLGKGKKDFASTNFISTKIIGGKSFGITANKISALFYISTELMSDADLSNKIEIMLKEDNELKFKQENINESKK